ncbi:hypothetical protein MTR_3g065940 [Medicago truncatula]|uniref:Uncharacterized protein n=1 Tax=Medicago truncatula TaxID=3880 RepID=A0A072UYU8_MEDTR|nr:hypothetical protein MTR_3g065940 [Medicago truncatula]
MAAHYLHYLRSGSYTRAKRQQLGRMNSWINKITFEHSWRLSFKYKQTKMAGKTIADCTGSVYCVNGS